jgi:hypothetical protein
VLERHVREGDSTGPSKILEEDWFFKNYDATLGHFKGIFY